jgi:organic radical activating enzyme
MSQSGQMDGTLKTVKSKLDAVSRSFCLAKWNQVTIHLNNGTTHSCHHCPSHKIPLEELKNNPSALHNTNEKKNTRKMMLNGERPGECNFCWRVEDLKDENIFSDRVKKSSDPWNDDRIDTVPKMPWDVNVIPKYIELDFSNACNFKCLYCSPAYSTSWVKEIKEHGPIEAGKFRTNSLQALAAKGELPFEGDEEDNPYIQAFWKWFPEVLASGELRDIRITGGEPLLSKNTFKLMDYLIDHPQPNLIFNINSNLGVPKPYIDKLIEYANKLHTTKAVSRVTLFTSGEGHGERGNYIRYGLNYKQWFENVDRVIGSCPALYTTYMCTYNALSVSSFKEFLKDALTLMHKHVNYIDRWHPVLLSVPYMRDPEFLAGWVLTPDYLKYIEECVAFMKENVQVIGPHPLKGTQPQYDQWEQLVKPGFTEYIIHDMERVLEVMKNAINTGAGRVTDLAILRQSFHKFIDESDRRRGTNFVETFPEMADFYYMCKNEYP